MLSQKNHMGNKGKLNIILPPNVLAGVLTEMCSYTFL